MAVGGSGAVEVGTAYVSVLPSTKGFNKAVDSSLSKAGAGAGKTGEGIGSRMASGLGKTLKAGAVAAAGVAAVGIGTALAKGFERATAIEDAQAKLRGLGNSAQDVGVIMDNALASVKGTAFGLDEAATTAAGAIAAGIKPGKQLEGTLKSVANSAAAAGIGMDEMGGIYNKVASVGKAQNDVLRQVAERGIPIYEALAQQLGVTTEEVFNMASAGEIGFTEFEQAMTAASGTVADELGGTTTGAIKNFGAALGRLGESVISAGLPHFRDGVKLATEWVDSLTNKVGPLADVVGQKLGSALEVVVKWLSGLDFSSWSAFTDSLGGSGDAFASIGDSIRRLAPAFAEFGQALPAIGSAAVTLAGAGLTVLTSTLKFLADNVDTIIAFMPAIIAGFAAWKLASAALAASQTRLMLAQTMMAPVFLASNILRWQAVRAEAALSAATATSTTATAANTTTQNANMLTRARSAAAMVGQRIAMVATTVATWAATAATTALGVAMKIAMGPIGLIIAGIALVVAGLVWFFTQTEAGKAVWEGFVNVLKGVWQWVSTTFASVWEWLGGVISSAWSGIQTAFSTFVEFLQNAWTSFIKPVLDGFMFGIQILGAVVGTIILGSILVAWNLLSMAISALWNGVIKPVWDAFAAVITWLWTTVIMPVFEFIKAAFMAVATTLFTIWSTIIKVVWDAFAAAVSWIWNTIIMPIFNLIKLAFQAVGFVFQTVWNTIIKPAWDALGAGISFVWNNIVSPVWNAMKAALSALGSFFQMVWNSIIKPAWDALGTGISWVVDNVVRPAFDRIKSALSAVKDFFSTVVDGIRVVWDKLKGYVADPINFVINTVWNNGLVSAWNTIAEFLPGLPEANPLNPIAFATGGAVFGPGTATSDSILARLSDGEHVLTAAEVDALGGHNMIYALRALIKRGEPFSWDMATGLSQRPKDAIDKFGSERRNGDIGLMPGFKDGGAVARRAIKKDDTRPAWMDQLANGHRAAKMRDGNPYTWGFEDCSGYMSMIADAIINGGDGVRKWATGSFPGGQPWDPGLSEGFSVGVHDNPGGPGGGHTAGTLTGVDNYGTVNVESGGSHGRVAYGGPAAGADDPQWDGVSPGRYHLAIGADGSFESAGGPSPEQQRAILKKKIQEIIDKAMDPIADAMGAAIGEPPPHWLGIPPAALDETKTGAIDTAFDFVDNLGDKLRAAYDLAKDVVSSVTTVVSGLFRDNGGYIPTGQSVVTNETGKPEAVLNWKQVDRIRDILASLQHIDEFKKLADVVGRMATTGIYDPRAAQFGIASDDDELVQALWFARDEWMKSALAFDEILRGAGEKAATGYRDEFLDFFGFGDIFNAGMEVYDAFNPKPGQTSDSSVTAVSTDPGYTPASGAVSQGQELVYGDPNITFETSEVELETNMPDLDASGTPGSGPVKDQVKEAFRPKGWDTGPMWDATDWIVGKESGWDPLARNPSSGAFGLFQFLGATKQTYLPDENPNPKIQGEAGARYITDRYGDPLKAKAFWEANGWYDKGGWLMPGLTLTNNETGKPEAVLNPSQWASITRQTDLVADLAEDGGSSGPLVVIENLHATSEEDAMRAAMREARRANRANALAGGWG